MRAGIRLIRSVLIVLPGILLLSGCEQTGASGQVIVERTPQQGYQPQALADGKGNVHVVYFGGDAAHGDLFYVRRNPSGEYTSPVRVNSAGGSAVAVGTVRGAQLAIGREGRVHIVWNGADQVDSGPPGLPLLYARLDPGTPAFTTQRRLGIWAASLDAGPTIAADSSGRVVVAWHANPDTQQDAQRGVFVTQSVNDGVEFTREVRIGDPAEGACACCGMRALIARSGAVHILYRRAGQNIHRDMTWLTAAAGRSEFASRMLDPWQLEACPLSSASLAEGPSGVVGAWETAGQIRFARLSEDSLQVVSAPGTGQRKHPVTAVADTGETLLAWLEGSGWSRGGTVRWQIYDAQGGASSERGNAGKVPAWGLAAVAPLQGGRFLLLY